MSGWMASWWMLSLGVAALVGVAPLLFLGLLETVLRATTRRKRQGRTMRRPDNRSYEGRSIEAPAR